MSNSAVGATYTAVIQRVLELSENDFLENGVEQSVLQELKENWQAKLSSLHIGHFPWDPPPPAPVQAPTVPSNGPKGEPSPTPASAPPQTAPTQQSQQSQAGNYGGVRIKTEPGSDGSAPSFSQTNGAPAYSSGLDRGIAQQRAVAFMERDFGAQAAPAIAGMAARSNIALPGQRPMGLQLPGQNQQRLPNGMQPSAAQQQQQQQQRPQANVYSSQTDGADEHDADVALQQWRALVAERRAQAEEGPDGRLVADRMFREQLEQLSASLDNGLMVPLEELPSSKATSLKRKLRARAAQSVADSSSSASAPKIPQLDGDMDDEDEKDNIPDDELINSDLDDSEDELAKEDDDETDIGDMMLCTYDKVQRVKNKWKCTLKDGVLTTNGKDYLFHKATGEFEW